MSIKIEFTSVDKHVALRFQQWGDLMLSVSDQWTRLCTILVFCVVETMSYDSMDYSYI